MSAQAEIPRGHPMRDAWEAYKATAEYANSRNWALKEAHVDGSMWAAFCAGYKAAPPDAAVGAQGEGPAAAAWRAMGDENYLFGGGPFEDAHPEDQDAARRIAAAVLLAARAEPSRLRDALRCVLDIGSRRLLLPSEVVHWEALLAEASTAPAAGKGVDDAMRDLISDLEQMFRVALSAPQGARVTMHLTRTKAMHYRLTETLAALTRQPVAGDGWTALVKSWRERADKMLPTSGVDTHWHEGARDGMNQCASEAERLLPTTPQPSAIEEGFSITVTVKDGEWTGTLEEWRQRPRSVVYRGPAAVGAQGDEVVIGATRCYGDDNWFRELTARGVTFLVPLDQQDKARHALATPAAGKGMDGVSLADIHLAAQMLTWGRDEGLTDKQEAEVDAHAQKLFAALTRQPVAGDGMVLVPREPSPEQVRAGTLTGILTPNQASAAYQAMLAAAPAATPTDGGEGKS